MSIYLYALLLAVATVSSLVVIDNGHAGTEYKMFSTSNNPLPPPPVVPCNVTKVGLPKSSATVLYTNSVQDYIPLRVICTAGVPTMTYRITCLGSAGAGSDKNKSKLAVDNDDLLFDQHATASTCYSSAYCLGFRDVNGNVYTVYDVTCKSNGYIAGYLLMNPRYYPRVSSGCLVKEMDSWSLVTQTNVPAKQPYTMSYTTYAGLQYSDSPDLSDAAEVTTATPFNVNFNAYCIQMTSRLTSVFGHSVNITAEGVALGDMDFPATSTEQVVGVYQLKQTFIHSVSNAWSTAVYNQNVKNDASCSSNQCNCVLLTETDFIDYYDDMFLGVSGVDRAC